MSRVASALSLVLVLGLLPGCKNSCRQLSEKLCECSPTDPTQNSTTFERETCLAKASNNDQRYQPTEADQETCKALLNTCDCHQIRTDEGKRACGLAR